LALIAWVLIKDGPRTKVYPNGLGRALTGPIIILLAAIIVFAVYLIPLPADTWVNLPGRNVVKSGYEQIGMDLPALPLSLTPDYTFNSLFDFLPPLAILLTAALTRSARELMLTLYAIVLVTVIAFPIGLMQTFSPGMYENRATMTTTFANQAHNDPLQLILELGVFGAGLMAAFALWFITACVKGVTASRRSRKLILILLVSILAVILHSLVDYPLRTIALASFTAFNVGYVSRLLRG